MSPEFIAQGGEGKDVESPAEEDEDDAPDAEGGLEPQGEAEEREAEVREHARLADEGQRPHRLLHCNLGHWNKM